MVLQTSKIAELQIFMKNLQRESIADSFNLNRATEVADGFNVGEAPHIFTRNPRLWPLETLTVSAKRLHGPLCPLLIVCSGSDRLRL
jgi:hypothetical protein